MRNLTRLVGAALTIAALALAAGQGAHAQAKKLKVALLVPALTNDGAFNQVALEAIKKLAAEGLVEYELRERMGDPTQSEPVIRQYAARGYDLIIGHGIEISLPILKVAKDFPNIHFSASGGLSLRDRLLPNVEGWTYDFEQGGYINGFIAARIEDTDTVGIIAGPQLPFIAAAHRGFKVGVTESKPAMKILETYVGSFDDVQKSAEAARGQIAQGATVLWTSGDGIGNGVTAAAAAANGKAVTLGATGEAGGLAKKVNVTKVELNMLPVFKDYVTAVQNSSFGNKFHISGLANKGLVMTPINPLPRVPGNLQAEVDKLVADLASGERKLPDFSQVK
jgi:basic membrane lipoprotein Med (substrate-binding protein (PBP1-ABC) superfamily)